MVELWGLYEGLKLLHGLDSVKVEINVDSTKVLKAILRRCSDMIGSLSRLNHIYGIIDQLDEKVICHSYREGNKCVDVLATVGYSISYS